MLPFLRQSLALMAVAALVAVGVAWWHPRAPAWYLTTSVGQDQWDLPVDRVEALAREGGEILWVDARREADYAAGHFPGAILLNEDRWGEQVAAHLDTLQGALSRPVVVYCDGTGCERSQHVAERLRKTVGLDRVYVLRGDWRIIAAKSSHP